jgi:hypothetical protein
MGQKKLAGLAGVKLTAVMRFEAGRAVSAPLEQKMEQTL